MGQKNQEKRAFVLSTHSTYWILLPLVIIAFDDAYVLTADNWADTVVRGISFRNCFLFFDT